MPKTKFSELIRTLRNNAGLTQEFISDKIGVTVNSVQNWEAGVSLPRDCYINDLAQLYNVEPDMLRGVILESRISGSSESDFPWFLFEGYEKKIKKMVMTKEDLEIIMTMYLYDAVPVDGTSRIGGKVNFKKIPYAIVNKYGAHNIFIKTQKLIDTFSGVSRDWLFKTIANNNTFSPYILNKHNILVLHDYVIGRDYDCPNIFTILNLSERANGCKFEITNTNYVWDFYDYALPGKRIDQNYVDTFFKIEKLPGGNDSACTFLDLTNYVSATRICITPTDKSVKLVQWYNQEN